jgi:hypothetical protein
MKRRQRLRFRHPSPVSLSQRHREQSDPAPCFRWRGTRQRQRRVPLMRFLRLSKTGRRPSPLKEAPPDRCHAVKPYRSSKLCLQGCRVPSVTRTDHGRCPDYGMSNRKIICRNNNRELSPGLCMQQLVRILGGLHTFLLCVRSHTDTHSHSHTYIHTMAGTARGRFRRATCPW